MWLCDKWYKYSLKYKRKYHWDTRTRPKQLWSVKFGHNPYINSSSWVLMKQKEGKNEAQTVKNHVLRENSLQSSPTPANSRNYNQNPDIDTSHEWQHWKKFALWFVWPFCVCKFLLQRNKREFEEGRGKNTKLANANPPSLHTQATQSLATQQKLLNLLWKRSKSTKLNYKYFQLIAQLSVLV